jgi:hypothetical protein
MVKNGAGYDPAIVLRTQYSEHEPENKGEIPQLKRE